MGRTPGIAYRRDEKGENRQYEEPRTDHPQNARVGKGVRGVTDLDHVRPNSFSMSESFSSI